MADFTVYYNPLAGNGGEEAVKKSIADILKGHKLTFVDMACADIASGVAGLQEDMKIVVAGGDGTLNRFANAVDCDNLKNEIYLFPSGNGNDFYNDLIAHEQEFFPQNSFYKGEQGLKMFRIDRFLKNLPCVTVNGKEYKFVNGIGYGIDGYCCEVGDKLKAAGKKVNYTSIAIKGLLFHFKPKNATVIVDGAEYSFGKVWIAPTMNGCYYGGGMIPTPNQNRLAADKLSVCVMYGKGRLGTLMAFPKIFKGEHVKKKKMVQILEGSEITVRFDSPCALQIDGETVLNVSEYTCTLAAAVSQSRAA